MKVYLIEEPATGLVKVGVSDVPYRRVAFVQTERERQVFLRHEHDAGSRDEAFRIERDTHILLATNRVEGEWFRCTLDEARAELERAIESPVERRRKQNAWRPGNKIPVGLRLTEEELALLNEQAERFGSQAKAVVAGLQMLTGGEMPHEVIIAELRNRLMDDDELGEVN